MRRTIVIALVAASIAAASTSPASAACSSEGYAYAGLESATPTYGIKATITALTPPRVAHGHVAAWVGVAGAGGAEWVQAGIAARPGGGLRLYVEASNGGPIVLNELEATAVGKSRRFAVIALARDLWEVQVNGLRVAGPFWLPGSHGAWRAVATGESWDDGQPACNAFSFQFDNVAVRTAAAEWRGLTHPRVLADPGYAVVRHGRGFLASART